MKKIITILLVIAAMTACDGPAGPPGPEGLPGPVGQGFEVTANFNAGNDYSQLFDFPASAEVLDTDIVLVYWLVSVDQQTGDDVWQQLPASVFFNDGAQLQYSFDHTFEDVQLYLTGDLDLSTVGEDYTDNQIFRVAILPVDYVQSHNIDVNDMKEVRGAMKNHSFEKLKHHH